MTSINIELNEQQADLLLTALLGITENERCSNTTKTVAIQIIKKITTATNE